MRAALVILILLLPSLAHAQMWRREGIHVGRIMMEKAGAPRPVVICAKRLYRVVRTIGLAAPRAVLGSDRIARLQYQFHQLRRVKVRPIHDDPDYIEFRKGGHKVILSLTTSPKRLRSLTTTLDSIPLTEIDAIHLNLPRVFGRDGSTYDPRVIKALESYPGLKIFWMESDLGPASKIIPTLERLEGRDDIVIQIDDDIAYSASQINELILACLRKPDAVIAAKGLNWGIMKVSELDQKWPNPQIEIDLGDGLGLETRDVLEGWAGIAYRPGLLNTSRVREMVASSPEAFVSDDLILSMAAAEAGVQRFRITSPYFTDWQLFILDVGLREDALSQNGPGLIQGYQPSFLPSMTVHEQNYRAAARALFPALFSQ